MRNVVIDLGNLEYLYSDTINAFIASNRHMLEVSGRIAILTEHPKVQDILKRAGLDNIMRIYRSEAEMIADSKEILRQTSSYRIEELQKFSNQEPEQPQIPRTEFDDFKAEMGQRLSTKLDNNELPQYQLGTQPSSNPGIPPQPPRDANAAYPTFLAPKFPAPQLPDAPSQNYLQGQKPPAYDPYNTQAPGNAGPTFTPPPPPNFNQGPANFDYPTVQLPVGQFGASTPQPPTPPVQNPSDQGYTTQEPREENGPVDPRQRMPAQDRMRSPNSRRPPGRRAGGRDFQEQDEQQEVQAPLGRVEEKIPTPSMREPERQPPVDLPPLHTENLAEESHFFAKLIVAILLLAAVGGGYLFFTGKIGTFTVPANSTPVIPEATVPPPIDEPSLPPTEPLPPLVTEPVAPSTAVQTPTQVPAAKQPVSKKPPVAKTAEIPKPVREPAKAVAPPAEEPSQVTPLVPVSKHVAAPVATPKPVKTTAHVKPVKAAKPEKVEKPAAQPKVAKEPEQSEMTAGLHITSNPPGAEVLINFSKRGNTPLDITLTNNSNKIIVRLPGYKRYEVTLPKNHPDHELDIDLEKEESSEPKAVTKQEPKQESKPEPKAEPKQEPKVIAKPEPKIIAKPEPKPEPKVIAKPEPKVEKKPTPEPEHEKYQEPEDLPVAKAKPEKAERAPTPAVSRPEPEAPTGDGPIGIIFLSSSPARANIIIDGKDTGKLTPAKLELPSGSHRIEMSLKGQKNSVTQIVNEGKNKAVHLTLQ